MPATATPIPGLATPEWAQETFDQKGENSASYQIRVLGEFPSEADDALIPLNHIEAAVNRPCENVDQHETVMGLDVARFGDAQTVAIIRRGPQVLGLFAFRKSNLMQSTGRALDLAKRFGVKTIYVDEVGMGGGVVDRMKEIATVDSHGVNGGNKPNDTERYFNLRTEMFDGLRQRFADGDISIPNDAELISQLAAITYYLQLTRPTPNRNQTANPRLRTPKPRQSRRPNASLHRTNPIPKPQPANDLDLKHLPITAVSLASQSCGSKDP